MPACLVALASGDKQVWYFTGRLGLLVPLTHRTRRKPIIGLTGGIGAGKSTVAGILRTLGVAVIDSDRLSHDQFLDEAVKRALSDWWGKGVLTAERQVDRRAVAGIVFKNAEQLSRLEGLLYPRIERRRLELMAEFEGDPDCRAIAFDTPKLYETGLDKQCDVVVLVDADEAKRVARLVSARGWSKEELQRREKLFQPLDTKRANADYVVENNSGTEELRPEVERVLADVLATFSRSQP